MSKPFWRKLAPLDLTRVFLVLVPCAPGLLFLLIGLARDPFWRPMQPDPSPVTQATIAKAAWQAHQLYLVGSIILLVGTLGMAIVTWKLLHPPPPDEPDDSLPAP